MLTRPSLFPTSSFLAPASPLRSKFRSRFSPIAKATREKADPAGSTGGERKEVCIKSRAVPPVIFVAGQRTHRPIHCSARFCSVRARPCREYRFQSASCIYGIQSAVGFLRKAFHHHRAWAPWCSPYLTAVNTFAFRSTTSPVLPSPRSFSRGKKREREKKKVSLFSLWTKRKKSIPCGMDGGKGRDWKNFQSKRFLLDLGEIGNKGNAAAATTRNEHNRTRCTR